jgi:DNA-binding MarR family transcriptional regulator
MTNHVASGAAIRRLLHRKLLASNRHRTAIGHQLDLRTNELATLSHLAEHGSLTPGELGSLLVLTSGGVTALLQRLERLGHLHRTPHPRDGRSWILRADPAIIDRAAHLNTPLVVILDAEIAALTAPDRRAVARFLTRVTAATEREADALLHSEDDLEPGDDEGLAPDLWT